VLVLAEWDRASRSLMDGTRAQARRPHQGVGPPRPRSHHTVRPRHPRPAFRLTAEERIRVLKRANEGARHQTRPQTQARRPSAASIYRPAQSRRKLPRDRQDLSGAHATIARLAG
jgi:hypothetical protein